MDLLELNIPNWEKWLKALRSGRYKKTQGALFRLADSDIDGDKYKAGFCCLGVVSRISRLGKFDGPFNSSNACMFRDNVKSSAGGAMNLLYQGPASRDQSGSYLTRRVQSWLGLPQGDCNPEMDFGEYKTRTSDLGVSTRYATAADLNDKWGLSLSQIADMLEYFIVNPAKKAQEDARQNS